VGVEIAMSQDPSGFRPLTEEDKKALLKKIEESKDIPEDVKMSLRLGLGKFPTPEEMDRERLKVEKKIEELKALDPALKMYVGLRMLESAHMHVGLPVHKGISGAMLSIHEMEHIISKLLEMVPVDKREIVIDMAAEDVIYTENFTDDYFKKIEYGKRTPNLNRLYSKVEEAELRSKHEKGVQGII
jgi:hypothetical protein